MTPTNPVACGCKIKYLSGFADCPEYGIEYCPLHIAAPLMLEALKYEHMKKKGPEHLLIECPTCDLISAAESDSARPKGVGGKE